MKKADRQIIKIIVTIVERGKGNEIIKIYNDNQIFMHYQIAGFGTATSEIMDILGLGNSEKDIILSFTPDHTADELMYNLNTFLRSKINSRGIVFDAPLTGLNNLIATMLVFKDSGKLNEGGMIMENKGDNSLILVAVNNGYTDMVMDTARGAGAKGGTIVRARWTGTGSIEQFYGITLQSEKEILAIVAGKDNRNQIMEAINSKHGLKSKAGGMICSIALDNMIML